MCYFQGLYRKAEALYCMGDFEYALMYYHRGHKLRPELDEFRLGIQKAQEAIDNSIGSQYIFFVNQKESNPGHIGEVCFSVSRFLSHFLKSGLVKEVHITRTFLQCLKLNSCFNESPLKMRKSAFYFILAVFALKILKFLS